jgi:hypothetical protein
MSPFMSLSVIDVLVGVMTYIPPGPFPLVSKVPNPSAWFDPAMLSAAPVSPTDEVHADGPGAPPAYGGPNAHVVPYSANQLKYGLPGPVTDV